ncbi:hypothetical protein ABID21_000074 [Pseudorhizobium tarimense]|uniref:Uncharacterized protein n=1 Tax=Pseudorhizobium tarimense TaxID=1079109 RepID=A0ABV2H0N6_9HYPH|nr:hypothetical protein [Pseudorhizobium tarimense]MCJ8517328.1 hypothetical protein [Pseudorhizobium tarimense]
MQQRLDEIGCGIFGPADIETMRDAFLLAIDDGKSLDEREDGEVLAQVIIRLYRMGLVDPGKLAPVASLLASSKLLRPSNFHRVPEDATA